MNEKSFLLELLQKTRRVFSLKHLDSDKLLSADQDNNREWIILIAIICMNMIYILPSIIYQAISGNIQNSWLTEYDLKEQFCFFAFFATDWINDELIYSWLTIVFDRNTRSKARNSRNYHLLFVDEHDSHINIKFLDWCEQNKMLVTLYSSYSTHRLQSLNVSLFNPLTNYYSQNLNDWIFKSQELSRISKRDFFDLFWPAYQAAFTHVNIKSEWKKTELLSFNSSQIIKQIKSNAKSVSSHSSSSALSEADWRKIRWLMKSVVEEVIDSKARKLNNTMKKLTTDVALLKAENEDFRWTVCIERSCRRREKSLFDDLEINDEAKKMFFSSNKIQTTRDHQIQRIEEKQQAAIQKTEEKKQRKLRKLEKQRLIAERKMKREKKKTKRKKKAKRKKKLWTKKLKQRRLVQKQKLKAKKLQKWQKKKSKEMKVQQFTDFVAIEKMKRRSSQIRSTQAERQFKASKWFDD